MVQMSASRRKRAALGELPSKYTKSFRTLLPIKYNCEHLQGTPKILTTNISLIAKQLHWHSSRAPNTCNSTDTISPDWFQNG